MVRPQLSCALPLSDECDGDSGEVEGGGGPAAPGWLRWPCCCWTSWYWGGLGLKTHGNGAMTLGSDAYHDRVAPFPLTLLYGLCSYVPPPLQAVRMEQKLGESCAQRGSPGGGGHV